MRPQLVPSVFGERALAQYARVFRSTAQCCYDTGRGNLHRPPLNVSRWINASAAFRAILCRNFLRKTFWCVLVLFFNRILRWVFFCFSFATWRRWMMDVKVSFNAQLLSLAVIERKRILCGRLLRDGLMDIIWYFFYVTGCYDINGRNKKK